MVKNRQKRQAAKDAEITDNRIIDLRRIEEALQEARERTTWLARFPEDNLNPVLRVFGGGKGALPESCSREADRMGMRGRREPAGATPAADWPGNCARSGNPGARARRGEIPFCMGRTGFM